MDHRSKRGAFAALVATALMAAPVAARADEAVTMRETPKPPDERLRDEVSAYFGREKVAARLFLGFGVASVAGGGALMSRPDAFARGAGYTLAGIGIIQAVAATAYHFSIDARVEKLHGRIRADAGRLQREELERMRGVTSRFVILRYTELALMAAGIALAAAGEVKDKPVMKGIGLGLGVEAFVFLGLDLIAEHSAHEYQQALARIPIHGAFVAPIFAPRGDSVSGFTFGLSGSL